MKAILCSSCFSFHPPECSLLNKAPPTPTMYKYRPTYSPGKNHTALTHAYANQVTHAECKSVCYVSGWTSTRPCFCFFDHFLI